MRLLSCAFSRLCLRGFGLAPREANLENFVAGAFIGDDCVSCLGSVLKFLGDKGGELCLIGEEANGDERAGRCGDEKSRLNVGIVASISSDEYQYTSWIGNI